MALRLARRPTLVRPLLPRRARPHLPPHPRPPRSRGLASLLVAVLVASATGFGAPAGIARAAATPAQLIGQKLVVAMDGTSPSAALLGRVERGEVGGVILFGRNITTPAALAATTAALQAAAARGGQPPLLISTDQEGGTVRRIPWAPPALSAKQMGADGRASTATAAGRGAGTALGCAGVNVNLAPVADVPSSTSSFMFQQGRTWSSSAAVTSTLANAFATAHLAAGSVPVMKHFPGIGRATRNTDSSVVTITATAAQLSGGLDPYRAAIANGIPMIMLSNATYPAWDATNAAGWSSAIAVGLLRGTLGFTGVSITDSLSGTAAARGVSATSLAIKAAAAGTDMLLLTGSEASTGAAYTRLVAAATDGTIPLATLQASDARIRALKASLPAPVADAAPPLMAAPVTTLPAGATLGTATVPVRTAWSATDPCGIATYALSRSVAGASWADQALAAYGTHAVTASFAPGTSVRYRARATDNGGRRSAWALGATVQPYVRQDDSGLVRFSGTWRRATATGYSGGTAAWATSPGASASYTFTGSSVAWVAAFGPTRGSAQVWVDGVRRATVSTHAATVQTRRLAWATSWPTQGTHTIRIVVVGTPGSPRVDVDAFARLWRP